MGRCHLLKKTAFTPHPGTKLLKADDYAQLVQANELLHAAEEEAQAIREQAHLAFQEKQQEGYEQGVKEGKMEISMRMIDTVSQTVDYIENMEHAVTETVLKALRKILGEIDQHDLVVKVVKNSLTVMRNQRQVTVRVAPAELDTVRQAVNDILRDNPSLSFLDVTADPRLSQGGCILESDMGIVDASIETQLEAIRRVLLQRIKR